MSVIAFDGTTVAADRQCTRNSTMVPVHKIRRAPDGTIMIVAGDFESGLVLFDWYAGGAIEERWPSDLQMDKHRAATFVVVHPSGECREYLRLGFPIDLGAAPAAWGCGADLALGAMLAGATAKEAVLIASSRNIYCGMGVDVLELNPQPRVQRRRMKKIDNDGKGGVS